MRSDPKYLSPRILQLLGVALLVASAAFWAVTGKQSALFMAAAMSLIGLGSYQGLRVRIEIPKETDDQREKARELGPGRGNGHDPS
jgi:hypothetical protein